MLFLCLVTGSPPPARGACACFYRYPPGCRITPACAGSIPLLTLIRIKPKDHPRLRGEHISSEVVVATIAGSPPPARGALKLTGDHWSNSRITPACAGSIIISQLDEDDFRDHPRLRGEHMVLIGLEKRKMGSPPPARGACKLSERERAKQGITPACAGSIYPHGLWLGSE